MTVNSQLTFNLEIEPTYNAADFYVSACNSEANAWIDRWPDWPKPGLLLYGPSGCGKTHLGHIWQKKTQAKFLKVEDLHCRNLSDLFEAGKYFILDDLNPRQKDEETLLHLYNLAKENQAHLLFLSRKPPSQWELRLADLQSRMNALPSIKIDSPDDQFLKTLAFKLFSDQQLRVEPCIIQYLLTHGDRSFKGLQHSIIKINACALAAHRNITLPFVREILKAHSNE